MQLDERTRKRFWSKVAVAGEDECWDFRGSIGGTGYGYLRVRRDDGSWTNVGAHRIAAKLAGMTIDGVLVCHKCDNTKCCNPHHFFVGTVLDNAEDMVKKGRQKSPPHTKGGRRKGDYGKWKKIPDKDIAVIRNRFSLGDKQIDIARDYGVSHAAINHIVRGRRRNVLG